MCEVAPYMVNIATKRSISLIYHSFPWYISYIAQHGTFDLNYMTGVIYSYVEIIVPSLLWKTICTNDCCD